VELHRSGPGPQFHLVVIPGVSKAPVFVRSSKPSAPNFGAFFMPALNALERDRASR
jgi:hypothetical protein